MAMDNRAPFEAPPPYINTSDDKHLSLAEPPPEYHPRELKKYAKPRQSPSRRKVIWSCFACFIILAAIIGGIVGGIKSRRSSPSSHSPSNNSNSSGSGNETFSNTPDFIALAAAECEPVTFVVYQKYDNLLYLRGELKSGTFNGTSSPVIPEQRLAMLQTNLPATGANLTAICEKTSDTGVVGSQIFTFKLETLKWKQRLYYYHTSGASAPYQILEASLDFLDVTQASASLEPTYRNVATNVSDVASIASVLLPPSNIRLYYLTPVNQSNNSQMRVVETVRLPDSNWSPPTFLPAAVVYSGSSPITASAVNDSSVAEIHFLFMNEENQLARKSWSEGGWSKDTPTILGENNQTLSDILGMSSLIQSIGPTMLRLYYISRLHVYQISISTDSNNFTSVGVINSPSYNAFPVVTENPPLISATSPSLTSNLTNDDMAQVFFVRAAYRSMTSGPDTAILNATVPVDGATWSVSTLGQDPNSPPNSTMAMPS